VSQPAQAKSWFDTGPAEPVKATAALDFTIIVPHIVYLYRPEETPEGKDAAAKSSDLRPQRSQDAFIAGSNFGTLVFVPADVRRASSQGLGGNEAERALPANSAYLVAAP
jgi:hypothetical protein